MGPEIDIGSSCTKRMKRKGIENKKDRELVGQYVLGSLLFTEKMNLNFVPGLC